MMVCEGGFSLLELRKLTLDELYSYYDCLLDIFEQKGLIDEEDRNKVLPKEEDTVSQLRNQLNKL